MKQMNLKLLPDGWSVVGAIVAGFLLTIGSGMAGCAGDVFAPLAGGIAKETAAKIAAAPDEAK